MTTPPDYLMGTGFNARVAWSPLAEGAKPKANRNPYPPIEIAPRARPRPVEPAGPTVVLGSLLDVLRQALPAYWLELYEESRSPRQITPKDDAWWSMVLPSVKPSRIVIEILWAVTRRGDAFWRGVVQDLRKQGK